MPALPVQAAAPVEEDTVDWDKDFLAGFEEVEPPPVVEAVPEEPPPPQTPASARDEDDFLVESEQAAEEQERPSRRVPELRAAPGEGRVLQPRSLGPVGEVPSQTETTTLVSKEVESHVPVEEEVLIEDEPPPVVVKTGAVPLSKQTGSVAGVVAGAHRLRVAAPSAVQVPSRAVRTPTGAVLVPTGAVTAHSAGRHATEPHHAHPAHPVVIEERGIMPGVVITISGLLLGLVVGIFLVAKVESVQRRLDVHPAATTKKLVAEALRIERAHTDAMLKEFFSQSPINLESEMRMWRDETGSQKPEISVFQPKTQEDKPEGDESEEDAEGEAASGG